MTDLRSVLGDITEINYVDAVVNTANKVLSPNGGKVNRAIHAAAGPELWDECRLMMGCRPGEAKLTGAYNLPVKYIIHTVGPRWSDGKHKEADVLAQCYWNVMELAEQNEVRSIAFPSIATGVNKYPYNKAADVAVNAVKYYLDEHPGSFDTILWVMLDPKAQVAYDAVINDDIECPSNGEDPLDYKLMRANRKYNGAYYTFCKSGEKLFDTRIKSADLIEEIELFVNTIANSPKNYKSDFKKVSINKQKFKQAREYGEEAKKQLEDSAKGAGAGVMAGAAVASLAPKAALWVATTFGTASTGTAISTLSGAAATKAALAWLGGGALAAHGGGVAAGQALLALAGPIGWGLAGVSIFASVLIWLGNKNKMQEQKKKQIEMIYEAEQQLKRQTAEIESLCQKTEVLYNKLAEQFTNLSYMKYGIFELLKNEEQKGLSQLVNSTLSLSELLSTTLGDAK